MLQNKRNQTTGGFVVSKRAVARAAVSEVKTKTKVVVDGAQTDAARIIQKAWRTQFKYNITAVHVKRLLTKSKLTFDNVKAITFESLVLMLKDKTVIAHAKALFNRFTILATIRHGNANTQGFDSVNVRVILAAYMIVFRSTNVFESMGLVEQKLFECACDFLHNFNAIVGYYTAGGPKFKWQQIPASATKHFLDLQYTYLKQFRTWKVPDEAKLTCRIKHALVALYQAQQHLPPDQPPNSPLVAEFNEQIARLRVKLIQIAGQDCVDNFDTDRTNSTGMFAAGATPPGGNGGPNTTAFVPGAEFPGRMTNEQLAHELIINPLFQLNDDGMCETDYTAFRVIRETFHRAFWESLVSDLLLEDPCYFRVIRVLNEVSTGMSEFSPRIATQMAEALDTEHLQTMMNTRSFAWPDIRSMVSGVVSIITPAVNAHRADTFNARWAEITELFDGAETLETRARAFTTALEFMMQTMNTCRVDAANTRLRLIAPVIQDHGIDYERGKFQHRVADGTVTTDNTSRWISQSLGLAVDLAEKVQLGAAGSVTDAHAHAVTLLVDGTILPEDRDFTNEVLPETLMFDYSRLRCLRTEFKSLVQANVVLLNASGDNQVMENLSVHFNAMDAGVELSLDDLALPETMERNVKRSLETDNALYKLVRARLSASLRRRIVVGVANAPRVSVSPIVLPRKLQERTDNFVKTVCTVATVNRDVHVDLYNELFPTTARAVVNAA